MNELPGSAEKLGGAEGTSLHNSSELFPGSVASWDATGTSSNQLVIPPSLNQDHTSLFRRLISVPARHRIRRKIAENNYAVSRNPSHGMPVAEDSAVLGFVKGLVVKRRGLFIGLLVANVIAGVAGLLVPRLLGDLIDDISSSTPITMSSVNAICLTVIGIAAVQGVLTWVARRLSVVFGHNMLAEAREYVIRSVLRLPLSRVESASTGDLITRVTRDVGTMAGAIRWALPHFVISGMTVLLTVVAIIANSWLLATPLVLSAGLIIWSVARYLRWAPKGYIAEGASYSQVNSSLTQTIEGIRTVEALGLQRQHIAQTDDNLQTAAQMERYNMLLRAELFLVTGIGFQLPLVLLVVLGALGYQNGMVTLGQITAATIYLQQLGGPVERLIHTINEMQMGVSSTTRLLGIAAVPADREPTEENPDGENLVADNLHFAYRDNHDVLHGIDLELTPGERFAIVGPSGSGKSTLGRLLAGINGPRIGQVRVGGVDVMHLQLNKLRTEVALVTQEHHVFVGSIRDNIILAREDTTTDEQVWRALQMVDAAEWVERLPAKLDTMVGSGNQSLTPAQAQQVALARLVIADPHTLVLDEATSLIDPRTARHVEGSMSALLTNRTVVAIAHRLHTAHDADRIAVVIDGKIAELGSHDELLEADGEYAKLWRAWTN